MALGGLGVLLRATHCKHRATENINVFSR